jgi:hypothetical protein
MTRFERHQCPDANPEIGGLSSGEPREGFPVARLGDLLLAMVPRGSGGWYLASAWRLVRPLCELKRDDFYRT